MKIKRYKIEIAVIITGVVLMVMGGLLEKTQYKYESGEKNENAAEEKLIKKKAEYFEYAGYYEYQIKALLENMEGVSSVSVAVYVKSEGAHVTAENVKTDKSVTNEKDSSGGTRIEEKNTEEREIIIIKDAKGNESVVFLEERAPDIEGIAVCVKGGANNVVKEKILKSLMALYGIPASKINIT